MLTFNEPGIYDTGILGMIDFGYFYAISEVKRSMKKGKDESFQHKCEMDPINVKFFAYRRIAIKRTPSIYFDAEDPTAKEKDTKRVESETSKGHLQEITRRVSGKGIGRCAKAAISPYGLKFNMERFTRNSINKNRPSNIVSRTLSMTDAFPTDALKYLKRR